MEMVECASERSARRHDDDYFGLIGLIWLMMIWVLGRPSSQKTRVKDVGFQLLHV